MILILGGVYQGKLAYALERFGLAEADVCFCNEEDTAAPAGKRIVYEIDRWVLALVRADMDVGGKIGQFMENNRDAIVICNDISCGVVPVDSMLRKWREAVGKSLALLAQHSDEVIRLFFGISARLK